MEGTSIYDLYNNMTIPEIVVDSVTKMSSGVVGSVSKAFDALVLNEAGTGLSMLAIWTLSFLGIGIIWKVLPYAVRFVRGRRR